MGFYTAIPLKNNLDVAALHIDGDFHLRDVASKPQRVPRERRVINQIRKHTRPIESIYNA